MRVRVIFYNEGQEKILLIYREKAGRRYWVIPGGGVETGETLPEAAIREIKEELDWTITVADLNEFCQLEDLDRHEQYYLVKTIMITTPVIHGEELARSSSQNVYRPLWVSLKEIATIDLFPEELQPILLNLNKSNTSC